MRTRDDTLANIAFGLALFFAALAPRLFVSLHWAGEPVWDGHYYDFGARRIAAGLGYSDDRWEDGAVHWHPWCHYPVGYSAVLGVAEKISSELMTSSMEQVYVRSEKGYVVINAVGSESVLVVLTTKEAKLGLVFIEVKRRCADLAKVAQAAA